MAKFKSKPFYLKVKGEQALFTDPLTKGGGEKYTYSVVTYQALKGVLEAVYWKPSIMYVVDSVKIINKIKTRSIGVRTLEGNGTKAGLHYNTYLTDVEYLVKYHFEWNLSRNEFKEDWNEFKHQAIILRSLEKGGRRDIFLGTRECVSYVERISEEDYKNGSSYYSGEIMNFGIMFHSFTYPSEGFNENNYEKLISNFTDIIMVNGEIKFIRPEECELKNILGNYNIKEFNKNNFKSVEQEYEEYKRYE